jgi:ATP-dependent Clp protease ATP-binding subunit ClpA
VTSWSNRDAAFLAIAQGIRTSVEELRGSFQAKGSASIAFDGTLLAVLNLQKDWCRQENVPFRTPSLLLVLLEVPDSVARRALENLRPGLATELERRLKSYVAAIPTSGAGSSFADFQWEERADVRLAQRRAMEEGSATVTERHLLLGILEAKSNTQQGLKDMLGEDDFRGLIQIVKDTPVEPLNSNDPTLGIRDLLQRDLLQ